MAEDLTEQSDEYKAVVEAMVGSIPAEVPFWERAQIRPRELTALQLEKRKLEQRLEEEAWHRVQETMPDDDIDVLAYNEHLDTFFIAYHEDGTWFGGVAGQTVTHWKELVPPEKVQ